MVLTSMTLESVAGEQVGWDAREEGLERQGCQFGVNTNACT